MIPYQ